MKKILVITITALGLLLSHDALAKTTIMTKQGELSAKFFPEDTAVFLKLNGKTVGDVEVDNLNFKKKYRLGDTEIVTAYSEMGNGIYAVPMHTLIAVLPNKDILTYSDESHQAKYTVNNGVFQATFDESIVSFDGLQFVKKKRQKSPKKEKGKSMTKMPEDTCKGIYGILDNYEDYNSPQDNSLSQVARSWDNEAQKYKSYNPKKLKAASKRNISYADFKAEFCQ